MPTRKAPPDIVELGVANFLYVLGACAMPVFQNRISHTSAYVPREKDYELVPVVEQDDGSLVKVALETVNAELSQSVILVPTAWLPSYDASVCKLSASVKRLWGTRVQYRVDWVTHHVAVDSAHNGSYTAPLLRHLPSNIGTHGSAEKVSSTRKEEEFDEWHHSFDLFTIRPKQYDGEQGYESDWYIRSEQGDNRWSFSLRVRVAGYPLESSKDSNTPHPREEKSGRFDAWSRRRHS